MKIRNNVNNMFVNNMFGTYYNSVFAFGFSRTISVFVDSSMSASWSEDNYFSKKLDGSWRRLYSCWSLQKI